MTSVLLKDMARYPELFVWRGPIRREALDRWLENQALNLPDDLVDLWLGTGGGDLFETKTLLAPFGDPHCGEDVSGVNEAFRARGLRPAYLIVSTGAFLTAIRLADEKWVLLDPESLEMKQECGTFEDWYRLLRAEFAERYGLVPLSRA